MCPLSTLQSFLQVSLRNAGKLETFSTSKPQQHWNSEFPIKNLVPLEQVDEILSELLLKWIYYKHLCNKLRVIQFNKKTQFDFLEY